jgi:hypothetical protein
MGYFKRVRNRNCAHFILSRLHKQAPDQDIFLTKEDWYGPIPTLTMEAIQRQTHKYSAVELKRATRLLGEKEHISLTNLGNPMKPDSRPTLILTINGKDALLDGYYKCENRKDLAETLEVSMKIIFPFVSLFKKSIAH